MSLRDFLYLFFPIAATVTLTIGCAMITLQSPDFRAAKACAWLTAIFMWGFVLTYGVSTDDPMWIRRVVIGVAAAIIAIALSESIRWIKAREVAHHVEVTAVKTTPREQMPMSDQSGGKQINPHITQGSHSTAIVGETVNINTALIPRHFDDYGRNAFIQYLKSKSPGTVTVVSLMNNSEANQFSSAIASAIVEAGWKLAAGSPMTATYGETPVGLIVKAGIFPDKSHLPQLESLVIALQRAGFKVDARTYGDLAPEDISVVIGENRGDWVLR